MTMMSNLVVYVFSLFHPLISDHGFTCHNAVLTLQAAFLQQQATALQQICAFTIFWQYFKDSCMLDGQLVRLSVTTGRTGCNIVRVMNSTLCLESQTLDYLADQWLMFNHRGRSVQLSWA